VELVETTFISEFTKKTLAQFGWKEGDAIPAELGERMLKMKEGLPASQRTDVLIEKELLVDEQVEEIQKLLEAAKVAGAKRDKKRDLAKKTKNMAPSVAAAFEKMSENSPEIIDDRDAAAAEKPAEQKNPEPAAAQPDPPPPPAPAMELETPAMASTIPPFCPRCGWDMRMKFEVVPTDKDKEDFLATLLGGTRFKKTYELFGGKLAVTFRSMLAEENKLVYRQLTFDQEARKVTTEAEWFVQMMDYRLSCSLDTITDKSGKIVAEMPELPDMVYTGEAKETPLVAQLQLISKNILAQEVTRRLVGMHLRQFQRLVEALEAMAAEPSFWTGIE
jgi:hypothetical protein